MRSIRVCFSRSNVGVKGPRELPCVSFSSSLVLSQPQVGPRRLVTKVWSRVKRVLNVTIPHAEKTSHVQYRGLHPHLVEAITKL